MSLGAWNKKIWRFVQRENLDRLLLIIGTLIAISSVTLSWVEPKLSFVDALWWSIVTLTTVGYGDIAPVTLGGRFIAVVNMIVGIGTLATFSATLASLLVEKKIKEELGMNSYKFEAHIILCEWNYRARVILKELRLAPQTREAPIILIADIDKKPIDDGNLFFIQGPVSDETLNRANLIKADTVIILGDDSLDYTARDAKVILSTLTVESINPNTYTIVELVDEAHVRTCKRANANEIIVSHELSSILISQATLTHGITQVLSTLLSSQNSNNQLYKIPIHTSKIGIDFIEVFMQMKQKHQGTVVAIQQGSTGEIICNPPTDYQLQNNDYLLVIANNETQFFM